MTSSGGGSCNLLGNNIEENHAFAFEKLKVHLQSQFISFENQLLYKKVSQLERNIPISCRGAFRTYKSCRPDVKLSAFQIMSIPETLKGFPGDYLIVSAD